MILSLLTVSAIMDYVDLNFSGSRSAIYNSDPAYPPGQYSFTGPVGKKF